MNVNPISNAIRIVISADELLLMILEGLRRSGQGQVQDLQQNEKNFRNCMLVNRQWCQWARKLLWKELSSPHKAFGAVLRQLDIVETETCTINEKETALRRPRDVYLRYRMYAAMVESITEFIPQKEEDEELFAKLELFDLKRDVFPRLRKVGFSIYGTFWFPIGFRNYGVIDVSITTMTTVVAPKGIIRELSKYCPRLERLAVSGHLNESDIFLLEVHRFVYLTHLSLRVDATQVDNFMRIVLSISHNLTDLTLYFSGSPALTIARRGNSFISLKRLKLHGLSSVGSSLNMLPSAPRIHTLHLSSCSSTLDHLGGPNSFSMALEAYGKRSPFAELLVDGDPFAPGANINLPSLIELHWLTDVSIVTRSSGVLIIPDPSTGLRWEQLQSLTLVLGGEAYPKITLHGFLRMASQAPRLVNATVRMDLRMRSNADLLLHPLPVQAIADSTGDFYLAPFDGLLVDLEEYKLANFRAIDFSSTLLQDSDQVFLFTVLSQVAPSLLVSANMLLSLQWGRQNRRDSLIALVQGSMDVPSIAEFLSTLSADPMST